MRRRDFLRALATGTVAAAFGAAPAQLGGEVEVVELTFGEVLEREMKLRMLDMAAELGIDLGKAYHWAARGCSRISETCLSTHESEER